MVSFHNSHRLDSFLESAQRDRMDETQTVPVTEGVPMLYIHYYPGATLLDSRNIRQLRLLQKQKYHLQDHPAYGATVPVKCFLSIFITHSYE